MNLRLLLSVLFLPLGLVAQDGQQFINSLRSKWDRVQDYAVQADIRSEIPLIKSFPVKATVYFKQKDQFKVVSKGIAILPKQSFNELPQFLALQNAYTALVTGKETIAGSDCTQVTVLPSDDAGDLVLLKLWVDTEKNLLLRSQTTTRSNGTVSTIYSYGRQATYGLPDQLQFTVDVKKFKIPKGLATDINRTTTPEKETAKNGTITVVFSDYVINKGLNDGLFKN
jgi:outer membrane lipoprotein-sorting protein